MKKLYLIGGPMGVGKTAASRALQARLSNCVFLDGDWCWDMRPFQVTEETRAMVLDNICHVLNNFLRCSVYEAAIFCWVMHERDIIDRILSRAGYRRLGDGSRVPDLRPGDAGPAAAKGHRPGPADAGRDSPGHGAAGLLWGAGHGPAGYHPHDPGGDGGGHPPPVTGRDKEKTI